jgi:ATP-dependent DNA ligase
MLASFEPGLLAMLCELKQRLNAEAARVANCRWLKPVLVGQFEFLEWTGDNHLRHTRFIGLREDKNARDVGRE